MVASAVSENRRKTIDPGDLKDVSCWPETGGTGGDGGGGIWEKGRGGWLVEVQGEEQNVQKMNFSSGVKMYTHHVTSTW